VKKSGEMKYGKHVPPMRKMPFYNKVQAIKVPFSSEVPLGLLAFLPIFLLDHVFSLSYTRYIKKQVLIKLSKSLEDSFLQTVDELILGFVSKKVYFPPKLKVSDCYGHT